MKKLILFTIALFATQFSLAQWEPDVRLTNDPAQSWTSYNYAWCIATSGETVHVVWGDGRDMLFEVYYKRSTDGGISWDSDTPLTSSSSISQNPSIAVSGDTVHIVWYDDRDGNEEIYYKRSIDGGLTWGEDFRLTNGFSTSKYTSVAVSGLVVHVSWIDYLVDAITSEVYYKRSIDGGNTWGEDTRLTYTPGYTYAPCMAVSGSLLHMVYYDYHDDWWEIYYKRSTDEGLTWEPDVKLTDDPSYSSAPTICSAGPVVHVTWYDTRDGDLEIYYKRSADEGITWEEDMRLTNSPGNSISPSIAAVDSNVHVVWHDARGGYGFEIYYQHSEDAGLSWNAIDTNLTLSFEDSRYSSIALADSHVHVVWMDIRDGNNEIYYKRNPTGNLIVGEKENQPPNYMQQFRIYPNPASSIIHIHPVENTIEKSLITIRDILGETLIIRSIRDSEAVVDVSKLPNGLYFVEITIPGKQAESQKLVIQR